MYLTAHHVKARDGTTGINTYLHRHRPDDAANIDWEHPDVARVANHLPGRVALQSLEVEPGGNAVLSHLDLVVPEEADPRFVADSLRFFEHQVREARFPAVFASHRIAIRFGIIIGLQSVAVAEYRRLRARLLQLVGITTESKVRQQSRRIVGPIQITMTRDTEGEVYQLSPESVLRVARVRPEIGPIVRVLVTNDTKADFETTIGDFYPNIVMALTGLSHSQLAQLGGAEILHGDRRLWRLLPEGDLPGQVLGVWIRQGDPLPNPEQAPTGAVLPRRGATLEPDSLALDLVQVHDTWLPLSEAGVHTYSHSTGLARGEPWSFVTTAQDGNTQVVYDASFVDEKLTPAEVRAFFGTEAAERARPDYNTMKLRLRLRT